VEHADFCVRTFLKDGNNEYDYGGIHIEQISKKKLINFLQCVCSLQLVHKVNFKKRSSDCLIDDITQGPSGSGVSSTDTSSAGQTCWYCHGPEEGDMIARIVLYHTVISHHLFADEETS